MIRTEMPRGENRREVPPTRGAVRPSLAGGVAEGGGNAGRQHGPDAAAETLPTRTPDAHPADPSAGDAQQDKHTRKIIKVNTSVTKLGDQRGN